jgi:hypothetical protein
MSDPSLNPLALIVIHNHLVSEKLKLDLNEFLSEQKISEGRHAHPLLLDGTVKQADTVAIWCLSIGHRVISRVLEQPFIQSCTYKTEVHSSKQKVILLNFFCM